ncbi:hypothetical protein [Ensifer aridi]|uniref:hypothetical protein n=1 Tax=Ensifer aridi TaxID=1708715 RepID=UPI000A534629|nr:hypothetical protein [Ensifer aridi]
MLIYSDGDPEVIHCDGSSPYVLVAVNWEATTYGVWRCRELSPAGRAAVTP